MYGDVAKAHVHRQERHCDPMMRSRGKSGVSESAVGAVECADFTVHCAKLHIAHVCV
jgi:hypothetical protein